MTVQGAVGRDKDASPAGAKRMKSAAHNRGLFGTRESVYDQSSQMDALTQYTKMSTVSGTHHRILSGYSKGDAIRMCMRIWSGFSKFIKSQCNKDRVIDTLFFGSFYLGDGEYVYVSEGKGQGAFGEFKLLPNSQNEHEVPMNVS
jgi:hypothetical protein|tara:strand:- start:850 stop:1284 length:435 start_codon:yes stop_codon:yes gene_type:complete